jgi:hypothetical protein
MAESKLQKLYDWLDERTGVKEITREALDEPIRGGSRWAYVFGSVLLFTRMPASRTFRRPSPAARSCAGCIITGRRPW